MTEKLLAESIGLIVVVKAERGDMMTTYRRRRGKDAWHWCKNCSNYPTEDYEEETVSSGRPSRGELCNECRGKERQGTCST